MVNKSGFSGMRRARTPTNLHKQIRSNFPRKRANAFGKKSVCTLNDCQSGQLPFVPVPRMKPDWKPDAPAKFMDGKDPA